MHVTINFASCAKVYTTNRKFSSIMAEALMCLDAAISINSSIVSWFRRRLSSQRS